MSTTPKQVSTFGTEMGNFNMTDSPTARLGATEGSRIGDPDNLLFAVCDADQSICATACAWTTDTHADDLGELDWVASVDGHRGKGLGNLVTLRLGRTVASEKELPNKLVDLA